jgi:hypothetical protein
MTETVYGTQIRTCLGKSQWCFRIGLVIGAGALVLWLAEGCSSGPARGEVSGKVTFKGNAVKEGKVTFLNPAGLGDSEADINGDGTYEVRGGVVVGEYVVEIKPPVVMVDTDPGKSPPAPVEKKAPEIPGRYRQQGSTPFKNIAVKAGKNDINFEMTP